MRIQAILEKAAQAYTDKAAIIFKGENITFRQLQSNTYKLANVLRSLGVKKGDKVATYLPNSPEYVYSYLACFCLGAISVPLDYMLKGDELLSCLKHSGTKILIARDKPVVDLQDIADRTASLKDFVLTNSDDEGSSLAARMEQSSDEFEKVDIEDSDAALIMYTSGTTGKPKGILLSHIHLDGSPKAMEHFVKLSDQDIKLCAIPLSHIAGLIYIQNCIHYGITLVLMERFNPYEFLRNIQEYKITCFHIVPAMYTAMLSLKQLEKFDLSSLRWIVVFGAPSSPEIMERFHKHCPNAQLLNGWGMTETCPPNTVTPLGSTNIASVGKPAPHCQIKIIAADGSDVPTGEIGEIIINGWIVMDGYYKESQMTDEVLRDGWLYTGDLGKFDEEGYLYIVGRKKEMIKVSGQIVYAPEVESALYKHDAVAEVAVIGIPEELRGEIVKAFVVLKDTDSATADDLRYFLNEHLANFKVPSEIELRRELPKNRTGKIDKEVLKDEAVY